VNTIRRGFTAAVLAAALSPAVASAAPPISFVLALDCSDGQTYDINFGAPKNQGTALFVLGDNSILTTNYYHLEIDGEVVIDSTRGLQGLGSQDLLTCTAEIDLDGQIWSWTLQGWITPRN
jgi:hypothetical protein